MGRKFAYLWALVLIILLSHYTPSVFSKDIPRFEGKLILSQETDGRIFRVTEGFKYFDSKGGIWRVPAGVITDGASVPRWAWSLFPPLAGKHLRASVLHDHYCVSRSKHWKAVHRVFYDALLTSDVGSIEAKIMYAAVYVFGPRWAPDGSDLRAPVPSLTPEQFNDKIGGAIRSKDLNLDEIESLVNELQD